MEVASLLGAGGSLELKSFFKDLMLARQDLPPEVIYRPKTWMQSPTAEWLRGPLGRTIIDAALRRLDTPQLSKQSLAKGAHAELPQKLSLCLHAHGRPVIES